MSWFIQADVNNGYPALNTWREKWQTSWTSDSSHRYPDHMWRIKSGINKGYPWIYPWFKETTTDTGDIIIGGSQSNYPNGFTKSDKGGIRDDFDDVSMITDGSIGSIFANSVITSAVDGRAFVISGAKLKECLDSFNDDSIFSQTIKETVMAFYGANIFDSIISCKLFPFDIAQLVFNNGSNVRQSVISSSTADINAFGKYTLAQNANKLASSVGCYRFGTIHVEPLQAWEIENIDFSIWLPMAGLFPIDIRGVSDVDIVLYVDMINGLGEYAVFINRQLTGTYRVMLGIDVPVNTNIGRMQANMLTNVVSTFARGLGSLAGGIAEGTAKGAIINGTTGIGGMLAGTMPHYTMNTPSCGGLASMQNTGNPRIVAKIPKMFKEGYGYKETLGWNRSTCYVKLNECSGYVKCRNYKTDIIVATDSEKLEIEQLMNNGVFI